MKIKDQELFNIVISAILFILTFLLALVIKIPFVIQAIIFGCIYVYSSNDIYKKCIKNIKNGDFLNEEFLMCFASFGAFVLGIWSGIKTGIPEGFDEACAVIILYKLGEWFSSYAIDKSKKSMESLMKIRPEFANLITQGGDILKIPPENAQIGDIILVNVGEKIPVDGIIIDGTTSLDVRSLNGESLPCDVGIGSLVLSGSINLTSPIKVEVKTKYSESTVSKILKLVETSSKKKAKSENFITRFSRIYTPLVVLSSFLIMIFPPLLNIVFLKDPNIELYIYRGLCFLIISCPCALALSIPLSYFRGLGEASKMGILVKGSIFLEKMSQVSTYAFDKTGTLTYGEFKVVDIKPEKNINQILNYAYVCENKLNHPIAKSITSYCLEHNVDKDLDLNYIITNKTGEGVIAKKDNDVIIVGNKKLLQKYLVTLPDDMDTSSTSIFIAKNNEYIGCIELADTIKIEAKNVINTLNKSANTLMLSGDREEVCCKVAEKLNIKNFKSSLLPQNKVEEIEILKKQKKVVAFTGDGINDSPSLAISDVGISMGTISQDAAVEASDVVILNDDLNKIITLRKIAKKTQKIVLENTTLCLGIKVIILSLSAIGLSNIWFAVFADVGVLALSILNTFRIKK